MIWERSGICQPEVCGSACCRVMVIETNPVYQAADTANWLELHGIHLAPVGERVVARVPLDHVWRLSAISGRPDWPGALYVHFRQEGMMATADEQRVEQMTLDQEKRLKTLEKRMDEVAPMKDDKDKPKKP